MNIETIKRLKQEADEAGMPIAYVSEPTPTTVRIVFADGWIGLSEEGARNYIVATRTGHRGLALSAKRLRDAMAVWLVENGERTVTDRELQSAGEMYHHALAVLQHLGLDKEGV